MSDVLTAPDDDLFWPPTDRTEAESHEVAMKPDAWIFSYLGSRVQSFDPSPGRVVVWCAQVPPVDLFALPASMRGLTTCHSTWRGGPTLRDSVFGQFALVEIKHTDDSVGSAINLWSNPPIEVDDQDTEDPPTPALRDLEVAVDEIKDLLGLTDAQLDAATGVSRTTLWRLRTGRTGDTRSVTEAPIWRLHALTRALVDRIGRDGTRGWLHAGAPSPASLLQSGDLSAAEAAADRVLFRDQVVRRSAAAASDDYETLAPKPATSQPATRKPRRARRPGIQRG